MASSTFLTPTLLALERRRDQIAFVRDEMRRIEGIVKEPRTLRIYVDLSRRLNAIQSTTRSLPIEVLSLIFQHASPLVDDPHDDYDLPFHLALRLVSSHWYYVIHSTPQLWTCIRSKERGNNALGQYIKLFLDNSGSLLLTIFLTFRHSSHPQPDPGFLVSPTVDDALRSNLYRITSIRLISVQTVWMSVIPEMVQLTSLFLGLREDAIPQGATPITMDLSMLTRIKTLSLSFPYMYDVILVGPATASVTHLELQDAPVDICVRLYLACQNLVDFRCSDQKPPWSSVVPEIPSFFLKRESLILLGWNLLAGDLSHWNDYILKWSRFPVLEVLWWIDPSHPNSSYDATHFFNHLPKSLASLEFTEIQPFPMNTNSLIEHIRHDCDISEIKLSGCSEFFINNVLQKLFEKTTIEGEEIIPFPELLSIAIDMYFEEEIPTLSSQVGANLVQLLEGRKEISKVFALNTSNELDWEDETWLRLKELESNGLVLYIHELSSYDSSTEEL